MEQHHDQKICSGRDMKSPSEKGRWMGRKHHISQRSPGVGQTNRSGRYNEKPCLADFVPDVMSQCKTSDPSTASDGNKQSRDRRRRKNSSDSEEFQSLRSPLHKNSLGRGVSSRRSNSTRSGRSVHQKQTRSRRVRKCLWADEEDEAFFEGDRTVSELRSPTKDQLTRRQKDIDFGKATDGYRNYLKRIPRDQRGNLCPETPDKNCKVARRNWDAKIRQWRRLLHQWDVAPQISPSSNELVTPTKITPRKASQDSMSPSCREKMWSPSSNVPSTPDQGYATTPESIKGGRSVQDPEEEEDNGAFLSREDFPTLLSSGNKKWWEIMDDIDQSGSQDMEEEDGLDACVQNLQLGN